MAILVVRVLPIYDALFQQSDIKHILVRHEQAAVHAAEGYARSTGKVGVVLVTSGPGATNTITGLTDALLDSIPIVCLTGQVPTHLIGNDAFQEADTVGISRPCTKYNYLVTDIEKVEPTIHEAFHIAKTGRPGPVVVDLPKDILSTPNDYKKQKPTTRKSYRPRINAEERFIKQAVDLLEKAKRPVVYAGGGVINSGPEACKTLTKFTQLTGFPITNTLMGLGCYPAGDEQFLGMLGMHGTLEANMCMYECDVMLAVGSRFDDRVTGRVDGFSPKSTKIHIDVDRSSINKTVKVDLPLVGDAGKIMEQILAEWQKRKLTKPAISNWWKKIEGWREKKSLSFKNSDKIIKPQYALQRLNELTKSKKTFITTDVGQHQMWAAQHLDFELPNRWMTSGGLGTMGYGFPAAVGAQIANPDGLVVCVSGEASIMMNIQELSTIVQYRLPVKIFILNNHYMGMVRQWQEMFHGNRYSESYMDALPDFVKLAESYGIKGMKITDPKRLDAQITEMIEHDGPVLCDCVVDDKENVYPMIPAGAAHNELVLNPDENDAEQWQKDDAKSQV